MFCLQEGFLPGTPRISRGKMGDTLKILQACGSPGPGGAQSFFLRLVRALHEHPETQVLPVVRYDSWLSERLSNLNISHETVSFGGRLDLITKPKLSRIISNFRPDVAQTWMNRASRFLPRNQVPSVGRLGGYYDLKYYQGLDYLVGNTEDICRYIREAGWPAERTRYIPNFVSIPDEGFKERSDAIRAQHGVPENVPVLLLAGRLHPNKGFDVALRALAALPNHIHALIAGEGEEETALKELAQSLGIANRVHFTGWVNAITPLCAAADIFVVSSRHEPLGNVVLEGWAHAMPVVAADAAGPQQLITPEKDGLLVPMEDPAALSQAIARVIGNQTLAVTLAEQGLETLNREFSEEAVTRRYIDFYKELKEQRALCAG